MTPAQAAHASDTSRWTIMRAIKAQQLRATRDNRNQWRITPEDLAAWRIAHPAHSAHTVREDEIDHLAHLIAQPAQESAHPDKGLQEEVQTLRKELDEMRLAIAAATQRALAAEALHATTEARAVSAETDRDRWHEHAKELAARIPPPSTAPVPQASFWQRIFRRT
ncbi:helix-turn-helix domain-containing protein [Rubellimicrobium rubrum]|uniref:Helix-turn-helix domain-containing protein n=1 Tax=Rubellimicrobium rubrum TaxID=2585369 RepID=A0A5C4MJ52_9RHOB|nr:helix-turn-helix domain-containing protein [Rubellimicrobium rubrum]TNC45264.1 helix-turn-helix domain-containing protein [Rubellimicrobium rubrum]